MIKLIRLDERLLHGQVAVKWLNVLDIESVLVADDTTALSPIATKAMLMSAAMGKGSGSVKTSIKTIGDAIRLLNDVRAKPKKIFVITRELSDLQRLINEAPDIQEINIGNYGTLQKTGEPRREIIRRLFLNNAEIEQMREIVNCGLQVYFQATPESERIDLKKKMQSL